MHGAIQIANAKATGPLPRATNRAVGMANLRIEEAHRHQPTVVLYSTLDVLGDEGGTGDFPCRSHKCYRSGHMVAQPITGGPTFRPARLGDALKLMRILGQMP